MANRVGPTPGLNCEAPIVRGFVSFNSLFGGTVLLRTEHLGDVVHTRLCPTHRELTCGFESLLERV